MLRNRIEISDSEINKSQEQAIEYFEEFRNQIMREEWFPVELLKRKLVSNLTNKFFSVGRRKRDCSGK